MVAGFISERWPASNQNPGRLHVGTPGRIKSESAEGLVDAATEPFLAAFPLIWRAYDGDEVVGEPQGGEHSGPCACAPRQLDHRVDAPLEIWLPARIARGIIVGVLCFLWIHPARFSREGRVRRLDGVGAGQLEDVVLPVGRVPAEGGKAGIASFGARRVLPRGLHSRFA